MVKSYEKEGGHHWPSTCQWITLGSGASNWITLGSNTLLRKEIMYRDVAMSVVLCIENYFKRNFNLRHLSLLKEF